MSEFHSCHRLLLGHIIVTADSSSVKNRLCRRGLFERSRPVKNLVNKGHEKHTRCSLITWVLESLNTQPCCRKYWLMACDLSVAENSPGQIDCLHGSKKNKNTAELLKDSLTFKGRGEKVLFCFQPSRIILSLTPGAFLPCRFVWVCP